MPRIDPLAPVLFARFIGLSFALGLASLFCARAQSVDQPYDTALDLSLQANAAPNIVISGANVVQASIPGSSLEQYYKAERTLAPVSTALSIAINYGGLFNFYNPVSYVRGGAWGWSKYRTSESSFTVDNDAKKISFNLTGGQDEGYQADLLQFFVSASGAKFVVTTHIQKVVLFKPRDAKAPAVHETRSFKEDHEFDTLSDARASVASIEAAALSTYSAPTVGVVGNGTYIGDVSGPTVYSTVRASAWELLVAATVNKKGQPITGEVVFDLPRAEGRQITLERWSFVTNIDYQRDPLGMVKVSAKVSNDLELQSFEPIDLKNANLTAEIEPLESTKTVMVDDKPMQVKLMTQDGAQWKAALGREGVQFVIKGTSLLSPITKIEIHAKPLEGAESDWTAVPQQGDPSRVNRIGYYRLVPPVASLGQNSITQVMSVCLGGLGADPKHLIPPDQSLAGKTWIFQARVTTQDGHKAYSREVKVAVVLPLSPRSVKAKTLPPAPGSDGGNGWFTPSPENEYTLSVWTLGIP